MTPPMVSCEMTSDKRAQKFHADDVSLPRSGLSASDWLKQYPDLGSVTSSVGNFCDHFSDVISQRNRWWRCEMLSVFSG